MRNALRLALAAAAVVTVTAPAAPANAAGCTQPIGPACWAICVVYDALDRPCPR